MTRESIKETMDLARNVDDCRIIMETVITYYEAKVELVEYMVEETIGLPMGVEPHKWSDYYTKKDK